MKNTIYVVIALIVLAGVWYYGSPATESPENIIHAESVAYYDETEGYLAHPETEGEYPGVILIHEWWGLNDDIKALAERFAKEGYVALAVDMYAGKSTDEPTMARELATAVRGNMEEAFKNLESAVAYLNAHENVKADSLASVGWCFGGGWAYQMAVNSLGTDASVMYYGQFDPEEDFSHMRGSILGHFGEEDAGIMVDNVREFQAVLETLTGDHAVYIYPNVGHGFANARGGTNIAYSEEAAEVAWERTLNFLKNQLQ